MNENNKELLISDEKIKDNGTRKTKFKFKIPKKLKIIIFCVGFLIVFILGLSFSKVFNHSETILDFGFKDVGELVTQEWYGRILEDSSDARKIFKKISIPFTTSRLIFSLDVEVLAGIDFRKIDYKISKDHSKITVILPKAKIYKYYQVPKTFKTYLDEESIFTNISSGKRHELEDVIVEKGKKKALDSGLLEKADNNAKILVEQMIKAKYKNIEIVWKEK